MLNKKDARLHLAVFVNAFPRARQVGARHYQARGMLYHGHGADDVPRCRKRRRNAGQAFPGDSVAAEEYLAISQYGGKYHIGCDAYNGMMESPLR